MTGMTSRPSGQGSRIARARARGHILAVDPGPVESAWLLYDSHYADVLGFAKEPNEAVLDRVAASRVAVLVIEQMQSYGMPVGKDVLDTVFWTGRFYQVAGTERQELLPRREVKLELCGQSRAKDANVRRALLDIFGGDRAKGTKDHPGPLYGISGDVWAALGVAVTWAAQETRRLAAP